MVLTYLFLSKDQEEAENVISVLQLTVEEMMGLLAEVSLHVLHYIPVVSRGCNCFRLTQQLQHLITVSNS